MNSLKRGQAEYVGSVLRVNFWHFVTIALLIELRARLKLYLCFVCHAESMIMTGVVLGGWYRGWYWGLY